MTRRGLLFAFAALPLCADTAQEVWKLFSGIATALSEGDAVNFLKAFDPAMPGYSELQVNVMALFAQYLVSSDIDLVSEDGDDQAREVQLDWLLQLTEQQDTGGTARRRELVHCDLVKQKDWRITSFTPLSLFAPPSAAQ